ncbi:MAG: DUF4416 family protein [Deltaproteobacteria bacterium]|nr:DUF4416 family protein [Deltaproteobacteria bacterium]
MSKSIYPTEAKAILLLLTSQPELADPVLKKFEKELGPIEIKSPWHPFESNYYEDEVGKNAKRCLVGFQKVFAPEQLPELKKLATKLEGKERRINIDPGIVDLFKVILVSGKGGGMKVALTKGAHAYTLLRFEHGQWFPFPWTYPDFKEKTYHPELLEIRKSLSRQLLEKQAGANPS